MRSLLLFFFLAYANITYCQSDTTKNDTSGYEAPIFIGGEEEMFQHIEKELFQSLTPFVKINPLGDYFSIRFKVDKFGDVIDINVASSSNPPVNRYLVGVFTNMPKWTPGTIKGEKATLQMEYNIIVNPGADGYGYYVTKNEQIASKDKSIKSNSTIKAILLTVSIGIMVLLLTTSKP